MALIGRRFVWTLLAAAVLAGCASAPTAAKVERLVVFGDSNVDTGNLLRLTGDKIPGPPNWKGRNSNGPNVVDYLAQQLGAKLESHAVSGATSGDGNIVAKVLPAYAALDKTGVAVQIEQLAQRGAHFGAGDLVVLWAGSNDIFGVQRADRAELDRRIAAAAGNIESAIVRLNGLGATRFLVANRTPREVLGNENDLNGIDLNKAMAQAVARAGARTHAEVRLYDAYGAVAEMMTQPARYGFSEVRALCINVPACAQDSLERGLPVGNTYVNWDGAHKTTRVHQLMAQQISATLAP